jgi:hypothetical protein
MQVKGYVTVEQVEKDFSWSTGRAIDALETFLKVNTASDFSLYSSNLHGKLWCKRKDNPLCVMQVMLER